MSKNECWVYAVINARIEQATAKAVLFGKEWIPRSQIRMIEYEEGGDSTEVRVGKMVRHVCIPEWLAEKRNIAY